MDLTFETIEALADLVTEKQLAQLTIEEDNKKITIKTAQAVPVIASQPAPVAQVASAPVTTVISEASSSVVSESAASANLYKVTSPMVGTFYRSPSPESPPFVEAGATISKGQTLCIIEAMKLMNELESEVSGVVKRVLIENGQPVEFGQVLMEVEV